MEDVRGIHSEGQAPLEEAGFGAYGLREELMSALARRGFEHPTPV